MHCIHIMIAKILHIIPFSAFLNFIKFEFSKQDTGKFEVKSDHHLMHNDI